MATAAENKNEPARPLAVPSPSVHPAATDVEAEEAAQAATGWRSMQYLRKRRRALCCCGCCVTTLVVIGLVILVLALTVFRVKDPRITMNGVWVTAISTGPGAGGRGTVATNATLTADVSVKNPNAASLRFSRSETDVYYKGQTVSVAYVPAGSVGADRTVRMNVTLDLLADRLASVLNGTGLILGQEYDLTTYTAMRAKVNVLGIIKKSLDVRMNCSVILDVAGIAGVLLPGAGAKSGVQTRSVDCVAIVS
uniref:Late embryogenesis abundant protein LEA-2 subgroup domain-containing protein n=1 Tax=Oryza punctata TaxID=4537 RepID=A0A0E0L4V3_ORYPU